MQVEKENKTVTIILTDKEFEELCWWSWIAEREGQVADKQMHEMFLRERQQMEAGK